MSLAYGAGGTTAALAVVGLCTPSVCSNPVRRITDGDLDMLFTGDGEAFNVGLSAAVYFDIY